MNPRDSIAAHPWRWIATAAIALILLAALTAALIVRSLLQPQRFTALLQSQLAGAGLILSVDKPASPALWPRPAVQLRGFRLSVAGATTPLLSASEARIVVPWHALLHRELAVERLEIETPRIDLDQLQSLLSNMPRGASAPQLPRIASGIRIVNGTLVRGDEPLLFEVNAETGALIPGTPFQLDASARDSADRGGTLGLSMVPQYRDETLRFEQIHLRIGMAQGVQAHIAGDASWGGGSRLGADLRGGFALPAQAGVAVASTPASVPPVPSVAAPARSYTLDLQIRPSQGANPMTAALKLAGEGKHIDMSLRPTALPEWWNELLGPAPEAALATPPLSGSAQLDAVDVGPLHAQGVQVEAGPQVQPVSASSAIAPAKAADPGH